MDTEHKLALGVVHVELVTIRKLMQALVGIAIDGLFDGDEAADRHDTAVIEILEAHMAALEKLETVARS